MFHSILMNQIMHNAFNARSQQAKLRFYYHYVMMYIKEVLTAFYAKPHPFPGAQEEHRDAESTILCFSLESLLGTEMSKNINIWPSDHQK